jgi:hypothetical protein
MDNYETTYNYGSNRPIIKASARSWAVFIGVATVNIVLLIKLLAGQSSTDLLFAICVITILLIFSFRFDDITKANFSKDGLEIDLSSLNKRLDETMKEVDNVFLTSMGPDLYMNLKKITSRHFGKYHKNPDGGLDRELRHLRNIGYIEVKDNSISKIPEYGENLSDYVWATDTGMHFVALRESIEQRRAQGSD